PDRLDSVLGELVRARAPLDRIERRSAVVPPAAEFAQDTPQFRGQLGCLSSHIAALERILASGHEHSMVLEDDFVFTSDLAAHLDDLRAFGERRYDYWVCLLGTSKYGMVVECDDLVSQSLQPCTNTEGYLISRGGAEVLLEIWRRAQQQI